MTDKKDERGQEEQPKIQVVDRRMLNEDERSGNAPQIITPGGSDSSSATKETAPEETSERPKLEILDGGKPDGPAPEQTEDDEPLSEDEQAELRAEVEKMEEEQFAALEEQIGRPLTEQEKGAVREQMEQQARSVAALEIAPMLQQIMGEMHARATVHLGLTPNPYTRLVARNDTEARLAIDAFSAILDVIKVQMEPPMRKEFERVLNDLRVNYVSITGNAPTGGGSGSRIIH